MARKTKKKKAAVKKKPTEYRASLSSPGMILSPKLGAALFSLEKELKMPVWVLINKQAGAPERSQISEEVFNRFVSGEGEIKNGPNALVIDSLGGDAKSAYKISRLFSRKCSSFKVFIPRYAKSAATLLTLGADEIYMGKHAELGPLDAQMLDLEEESYVSALDTVQSLERLRAFSLASLDEAMFLMVRRTHKKMSSVIPDTMDFVSKMVGPLFSKVNIIEYTKMSRILKVAEEYAKRLLKINKTEEEADKIAGRLVEQYPDHGFFIGPEEVSEMGLPLQKNSAKIDEIMDYLYHLIAQEKKAAFGRIEKS